MDDLIERLTEGAVPGRGILTSRIVENTFTGRPLQLEHALHVTLALGEPGRSAEQAVLDLTLPASGVRSWRDWGNRALDFPRQPDIGQADGSPVAIGEYAAGAISRGDRRLSALCTSVTTGVLSGERVAALIRLVVFPVADPSFRAEGADVEVRAEVEIGGVLVIGDIGQRVHPHGAEAEAMARRFIDVDAYQPGAEHGVTIYRPPAYHPPASSSDGG